MSDQLFFMRPNWWSANATVTGTTDPDYPPSRLCDTLPGYPVRGTTGSLALSITNPQGPLEVVVIGHHNLVAGQLVIIDGDVGATLVAPTVPPDGVPINFFGYVGSPASANDITMAISGHAVPPVIGELAAGALDSIGLPLLSSHEESHLVRTITPAVDISSMLPYDKAAPNRVFKGTYIVDYTDKAAVLAWWQAERGGSRPSVIWPDIAVGDPWFVTFAQPPAFRPFVSYQTASGNLWFVDLVFEELPRSRW